MHVFQRRIMQPLRKRIIRLCNYHPGKPERRSKPSAWAELDRQQALSIWHQTHGVK